MPSSNVFVEETQTEYHTHREHNKKHVVEQLRHHQALAAQLQNQLISFITDAPPC